MGCERFLTWTLQLLFTDFFCLYTMIDQEEAQGRLPRGCSEACPRTGRVSLGWQCRVRKDDLCNPTMPSDECSSFCCLTSQSSSAQINDLANSSHRWQQQWDRLLISHQRCQNSLCIWSWVNNKLLLDKRKCCAINIIWDVNAYLE